MNHPAAKKRPHPYSSSNGRGWSEAEGEGAKIHVIHLIGSTGLFGAERWILALMRALDPERIESTLINLVDGAEKGKIEIKKSSDVVAAARRRGLFSKAFDFPTGGRLNPWAAVRLAGWARAHDVDIIHAHGYKSDIIGLISARLAGCKIITTPHGWSFEKDRKLALYERLDRAVFRLVDCVCPLSPALADGIRGCRTDKVRLIMNGVDIDEMDETPPAEMTNPGGVSIGCIIGYIGQLIERKDLGTLLGAVKKLLVDDKVEMRLIVIGSGSRRAALEDEASRLGIAANVDFMGFRADAARFLKRFHLFVLPSLLEGIPRCLMEAMAAGVPVVASDIPGNRQLVSHGETGLLFAPGDPEDLAAKLRHAIGHRREMEEMAAAARRKVESEFSNRRMAAEYSTLYGALAAK